MQLLDSLIFRQKECLKLLGLQTSKENYKKAQELCTFKNHFPCRLFTLIVYPHPTLSSFAVLLTGGFSSLQTSGWQMKPFKMTGVFTIATLFSPDLLREPNKAFWSLSSHFSLKLVQMLQLYDLLFYLYLFRRLLIVFRLYCSKLPWSFMLKDDLYILKGK